MRVIFAFFFLVTPLFAQHSLDNTLVILGIADWKGDFGVDQSGRGGLAVLQTWRKQLAERLAQTGGHCVLVHAGNLTGTESAESFEAKLARPAPGIPGYMDFNALGLATAERKFIKSKDQFVSWEPGEKEKKYIVLQKAGQTILISAFSNEKAPEAIEGILQVSVSEESAFNIVLAADKGAASALAKIPIHNIHEAPEESMKRTVIIESGAKNLFYRDPSGAFLCQVSGRTVCYVEIKFRENRVIGVTQRFVDLNGANEPTAFLKPDPILMDVFRKP